MLWLDATFSSRALVINLLTRAKDREAKGRYLVSL
jgi:hypothetical protein